MTQLRTLVLDCEGFSAWLTQDRKVLGIIYSAWRHKSRIVASANTIIEVSHAGLSMPRLNWALSHVKIEPVTEQSAEAAARLLKETGLHGHKYALDATVAETALRQPGPVAVLTSDVDDMRKLCGQRVRVIPV
ncbi:DNA-binding protein [Streptomyces niveiscabiei]|uniref:PIN domain-containing protein n=1 Tax=Streptomyces niveiscabiei TaxID=164115 RepID=UPI0029B8A97E|nr:PIN domain-containing protein [Streptomyces niveiscabiei]MDX3384128.1 DNA-binding protein [Streptomyces niveiscabiei]